MPEEKDPKDAGAAPEGDQAGAPDTDGQQVDSEAEVAKWKALSRKHEAQAKANAEAARRLKELEDADKSEVTKLNERTVAAEKLAAEAQRELLRLRVASRKGLTEAQAKRLVGETEEELEADAEELLESFGAPKKSATDNSREPTRPKERLRPGAAPDDEPDETDPRKLAAAVPRL
jgi:uncharacterized membrane protein YqiK